MDFVYLILGLVAGAALGLVVARVLGVGRSDAAEKAAEQEAKSILKAAQSDVDEIKKAAQVEGKELAFKIKSDVEEEVRKRKADLGKQEEELKKRERDIERQKREREKREKDLKKRERTIDGREKAADSMASKAEAAQEEAKRRLEKIAGLSAADALVRLQEEMRGEAREKVAEEIKQIEDAAEEEAAEKSKTIIATAIQRFASEFVHERTVAVVPLPSDDMKGRLIGREGRNIRALEAASGIDMIIDDTASVITISCFNPVRREIARIAISSLVSDGRIHPTRIEEVVKKSEKEVAKLCKEAGEQAVFDLGLHRVHPELIRLLGTLKLRTSYAQNVLQHSVEVGFLAGLMASEIGVSVKLARRAGLLHDIGKAVDHEFEGTHAEVGAQLARKHGESPRVCQAIASHHESPAPSSVLDHLVDAANRLSSARPGARRELLASYVKRLEDLEGLCKSFDGVNKAYALQAGRELRVMVQNDKVSDAQALMLSKEIARKIENEATYAGTVRVVVLRETRASEYAS